jgi:hypothetical protein
VARGPAETRTTLFRRDATLRLDKLDPVDAGRHLAGRDATAEPVLDDRQLFRAGHGAANQDGGAFGGGPGVVAAPVGVVVEVDVVLDRVVVVVWCVVVVAWVVVVGCVVVVGVVVMEYVTRVELLPPPKTAGTISAASAIAAAAIAARASQRPHAAPSAAAGGPSATGGTAGGANATCSRASRPIAATVIAISHVMAARGYLPGTRRAGRVSGSPGLKQDPDGSVRFAAPLNELDRRVQVDVRVRCDHHRGRPAEPDLGQLLHAPPNDPLALSLIRKNNLCRYRSHRLLHPTG